MSGPFSSPFGENRTLLERTGERGRTLQSMLLPKKRRTIPSHLLQTLDLGLRQTPPPCSLALSVVVLEETLQLRHLLHRVTSQTPIATLLSTILVAEHQFLPNL